MLIYSVCFPGDPSRHSLAAMDMCSGTLLRFGTSGFTLELWGAFSGGSGIAQLSPHWGNILSVFDKLLQTLQDNHVPPFLVKKLFQQLFSFVNVQLFNQLLLRRECCSFMNGEYVKTGLAEVENWIHTAGKEWVGESWDELRYIRQVPSPTSPNPRCPLGTALPIALEFNFLILQTKGL